MEPSLIFSVGMAEWEGNVRDALTWTSKFDPGLLGHFAPRALLLGSQSFVLIDSASLPQISPCVLFKHRECYDDRSSEQHIHGS